MVRGVVVSRTRRRPRSEREPEMLEAAGEAFARLGFHGASMDAIAAAAGISKPMLYRYFGSKEGLHAAYVQRATRSLLDALSDASAEDDPIDTRIQCGVAAFLSFVECHRAGWSVLLAESVSGTGAATGGVTAARSAILALVAEALEALAPGNPLMAEARAHALIGAGESLANWWLEHPDVPREQVAALLVSLYPL